MSRFPDIYSLRKNLAITERQRRALRRVILGSALGLIIGLIAWDLGIIDFFARTLRDACLATWGTFQDLADASMDFIQFISRQRRGRN